MSLKVYLAEKYMSGPKADAILSKTTSKKPKKRKATAAGTASTSFIKDDDLSGWGDTPQDDDDNGAEDAVVAADRRFKKRQRVDVDTESGWQTVREGEGGSRTPPPAEDEQPQVVETEEQPFKGGLLTSAQLKKKLPKTSKQDTKESREEAAVAAQETVYRDASGRKVDMAAERAEAARLKREREEKEAEKMEWGKGVVQREDADKRRKEEAAMRSRAFARTADDAELNAELKTQERWNDPAAAFLTKKRTKGPRKLEYTGPPPPPNRFGIKPGYRWDGVDRSNGFEKKFYQKQNERRRRGAESYEWSVDDM